MTRLKYTPQALFQDGSDLPLFTGYNPAPETLSSAPSQTGRRQAAETPVIADAVPSLPVYRTTRVVTFFATPPDRWGMLGGDTVEVCSGTLVSILGHSPYDLELYLVEHEGRFAWTFWVTAI